MFGSFLTPTHLIFVLIAAMLIFGTKRLPELGRTLGSGIKEFKSGLNGNEDQEKASGKTPEGGEQ